MFRAELGQDGESVEGCGSKGLEEQEKDGRREIKRDGRQDPSVRRVDSGPCCVWPSNSGCHATSVSWYAQPLPDLSIPHAAVSLGLSAWPWTSS